MTYEQWRIQFQSSEQAARAAFEMWQDAAGRSLPDGFPWDAETRRQLFVSLISVSAVSERYMPERSAAANQLADWLEGIEDALHP